MARMRGGVSAGRRVAAGRARGRGAAGGDRGERDSKEGQA